VSVIRDVVAELSGELREELALRVQSGTVDIRDSCSSAESGGVEETNPMRDHSDLVPADPLGACQEERAERSSFERGDQVQVHPADESADPHAPASERNAEDHPRAGRSRNNDPEKEPTQDQERERASERTR
jgi:hypothetical protein